MRLVCIALLSTVLPRVANSQEHDDSTYRGGTSLVAGLGAGQITNRYGALKAWSGHLGVGVNINETVARLEYFRVAGKTALSPTRLSHSFLGLVVERWPGDRLLFAVGLGASSLSRGDRQQVRWGASLAMGGVPYWINEQIGLTTQFRILVGRHNETLHVTGAALVGVALR